MRPFSAVLILIAVARSIIGAAILLLYDPNQLNTVILSVALFGLAQISDFVDGPIARKYSVPTVEGYLQDSIADKLFHIGCLLSLISLSEWISLILWAIVAREFLLLGMRILSNRIDQFLKDFKWYSVIYATFLRIGLFILLASPLSASLGYELYAFKFGFSLISVAAVFGLAVTYIVFSSHFKNFQ